MTKEQDTKHPVLPLFNTPSPSPSHFNIPITPPSLPLPPASSRLLSETARAVLGLRRDLGVLCSLGRLLLVCLLGFEVGWLVDWLVGWMVGFAMGRVGGGRGIWDGERGVVAVAVGMVWEAICREVLQVIWQAICREVWSVVGEVICRAVW